MVFRESVFLQVSLFLKLHKVLLDYNVMNKMDSLNYQDSASTRLLSRASIISLLGSYQKRLDALEKRPTLGGLSHTLIVTIILVQFIALATFGIAVYQNQRKISTLQTELNTLEGVSKDQRVSGKTDLVNTDTL